MIELRSVSYSYKQHDGSVLAVDDVSMTVGAGQFLVVLGPNGSGKSTFAKLLNGLLIPDAGQVVVDGLSTLDPDKVWEVRQRVGMVFQNPDNQIVATVVEEDVAFGPENLGVAPEEIRQRVDEALAAVGAAGLARREPHLLSGGQKQRVAIAGALAMRPSHIVLDEATSMLDPKGRTAVLGVLKDLNERHGITVILITHNVEDALGADRIVVMDRGSVALEGRPEDVLGRADELDTLGVGVPAAVALGAQLAEMGLSIGAPQLSAEGLVKALCRP